MRNGNLLKMSVSEIRVNQIRVNQGLGVLQFSKGRVLGLWSFFFQNFNILNDHKAALQF